MSIAFVLESVKGLGAIEVFSPTFARNLITAKLHEEAALKSDTRMDAAFDQLNRERSAAGKKAYHPAIRYRIILPPEFHEFSNRLEFVLDWEK